ncbi:hypothetical protein F5878DRAFT_507122, partial [Lentinula raphanica]
EPQIHEAFQINAMKSLLKHLSWDRDVWNTRRDIKRFLEAGFANVREHPRTKHLNFPDPWPDSDIIEEIVEKACGQFVYASTVLNFVAEKHSHPLEQLSIIRGLKRVPQRHLPFKELDLLYEQILSSYPDPKKVVMILGTFICLGGLDRLRRWNDHPCGPCIAVIEVLSGLQAGEVALVLRGMHSVLKIDNTHIQILHTSFQDYLSDKSRSRRFY